MTNIKRKINEFRKKLLSKKGFTLTEMLVVMFIIGVLASMSATYFSRNVDEAKVTVAKADARNLLAAIVLYKADVGSLPAGTTGSALCTVLKGTATGRVGQTVGPWMATCPEHDPWGNDYKFDSANMVVYTQVPTEVGISGANYITTKDLSKFQSSANP